MGFRVWDLPPRIQPQRGPDIAKVGCLVHHEAESNHLTTGRTLIEHRVYRIFTRDSGMCLLRLQRFELFNPKFAGCGKGEVATTKNLSAAEDLNRA